MKCGYEFSINRIRLEFKGKRHGIRLLHMRRINRIRLEFKGKSSPEISVSASSSINRIRLEFKGNPRCYAPSVAATVLIESDWNLKVQQEI